MLSNQLHFLLSVQDLAVRPTSCLWLNYWPGVLLAMEGAGCVTLFSIVCSTFVTVQLNTSWESPYNASDLHPIKSTPPTYVTLMHCLLYIVHNNGAMLSSEEGFCQYTIDIGFVFFKVTLALQFSARTSKELYYHMRHGCLHFSQSWLTPCLSIKTALGPRPSQHPWSAK